MVQQNLQSKNIYMLIGTQIRRVADGTKAIQCDEIRCKVGREGRDCPLHETEDTNQTSRHKNTSAPTPFDRRECWSAEVR